MPRFPIPEILRTPLEALFLQVKAMNEDTDVKAFLRCIPIVIYCKQLLTLRITIAKRLIRQNWMLSMLHGKRFRILVRLKEKTIRVALPPLVDM